MDTTTDEEAAQVHFGMWDTNWRVETNGSIVGSSTGPMEGEEFWYAALEKVKDQPDERIKIARGALPINAAWREIATGFRAKIRAARKANTGYGDDLKSLHQLAALHSFGFSEVRGLGYDFMAMIPFSRLAALDLDFQTIGCNALSLLGVTDRKWMIEFWGEPDRHTSAMAVYEKLYDDEAKRIKRADARHKKEQRDRLFEEMDGLLEESPLFAEPVEPPLAPTVQGMSFLKGLFRGLFRS